MPRAPRLVLAAGLLAVLAAAPAQAGDAAYPCAGDYRPLVKRDGLPRLLTALVPPLALIDALGRDHLAEAPRRRVAFRVIGPDGEPAPRARVAFLHRKNERFVAELDAEAGGVRLPAGTYTVNAAGGEAPVRWGTAEVEVAAGRQASVTVRLDHALREVVPRPGSAAAPAGTVLAVPMSGFDQGRLAALAADGREATVAAALDEVGEGRVRLPSRPGRYRIVYRLCAPRLTLAEWPVEVEPAEGAIEAPAEVRAGDPFEFTVDGRSAVATEQPVMVAPGADADADPVATAALVSAEPPYRYRMIAPVGPGRYDIAMPNPADGRFLLRRAVTVTARAFALALPETISLEEPFALGDAQPDGTAIEVWALGPDGLAVRRLLERLAGDDERFPAPAGRYELRLVMADDGRILARQRVEVTGRVFSGWPERVAPGRSFTVTLAKPGLFFDEIAIVPAGRPYDGGGGQADLSLDDRTELTLTAPKRRGRWDLVYVMGRPGHGGVVLERATFEVR